MTTHEKWCEVQKECVSPGTKPCTMCKRAYEAGREGIEAEVLLRVNRLRAKEMLGRMRESHARTEALKEELREFLEKTGISRRSLDK